MLRYRQSIKPKAIVNREPQHGPVLRTAVTSLLQVCILVYALSRFSVFFV